MKFRKIGTLVALSMITVSAIYAQSEHVALNRFLVKKMKRTDRIGMQAAYISQGELTWVGSYGLKTYQTDNEVNDSALFMVASISKPVTALALMKLYDQGKVRLDDNINDYLPFEVKYETEAWGPHKFYIEDVLLEQGYAVLYCNKRGLGNSTGNWKKIGAEHGVTCAGVHLSAIPFIEAEQIGSGRSAVNGDHQGITFAGLIAHGQDEHPADLLPVRRAVGDLFLLAQSELPYFGVDVRELPPRPAVGYLLQARGGKEGRGRLGIGIVDQQGAAVFIPACEERGFDVRDLSYLVFGYIEGKKLTGRFDPAVEIDG